MQDEIPGQPIEYGEDIGGPPPPSIDLFAVLAALRRRWKLIAAVTLSVSAVVLYGVQKLVPMTYKSTVEILIYDPQGQIDTAVQKPISPLSTP